MFKWVAESDDGCFNDESVRSFPTQEECYMDMMNHAVNKMKWNIDYKDVTSDVELYEEDGLVKTSGEIAKGYFDPPAEDNWCIGYRLECHPHMIQHKSYSGIYTYKIVKED